MASFYLTILLFSFLYLPCAAMGQSESGAKSHAENAAEQRAQLPSQADIAAQIKNDKDINVTQTVDDEAIQQRIQNILLISEWFSEVKVTAKEGIVVINGVTSAPDYRDWAGSVATRTEGVVAVINKITVTTANNPSFSPIVEEARVLWTRLLGAIPYIAISITLLLIFYLIARYVNRFSFRLMEKKIPSLMLRRLLANLAAAPVLLIGIYLILRITGLTKVAATVVGGTGLIGLVLGFAFRDIVENFLASILISIQRPFRLGETIRVLDYTGVVQAVTTRGTVLMTLDGNHVQIPNTTIYKEAIVNLSANPNMRLDFAVGIGYDASIATAQEVAMKVLVDHPAVLSSPEPWVLAEALSASTVNLRIYFWVNNNSHNPLKVKSAIIRNVKYAFMANNISMPDDAREVIFPQGIHVTTEPAPQNNPLPGKPSTPNVLNECGDEKTSTNAEGNLDADVPNIKSQADRYALDSGGTNLLTEKSGN